MIPKQISSPYQHEVNELGLPSCPFCKKELIFKNYRDLANFFCQNPRVSEHEETHSYLLEYIKTKDKWELRFIAVENNKFRLTHFFSEDFVNIHPLIRPLKGFNGDKGFVFYQVDYSKTQKFHIVDWPWTNMEELQTKIKVILAFQ